MSAQAYARAHHNFLNDISNDLADLILTPDHLPLSHEDLLSRLVALHSRVYGYLHSVPPLQVESHYQRHTKAGVAHGH